MEHSISIGRRPVFDVKGQLWGYQLSRISDTTTAAMVVGIESSAYMALQQILSRKKKIIVDFDEKSILERLPHALPPSLASIKITERIGSPAPIIDELKRLKAEGYLIAVGAFSANPDYESLYQLADVIAIDSDLRSRTNLSAMLAAAKQYNAVVMADCVADRALHGMCRELGFSLFHGGFFKTPETITVRKLSSNELLRLQLLREVEQEDPDLAHMAEIIQTDATISYRLLRYLNSAAFAFSHKIGSIRQAITMLGWTQVREWLRVVVLTDIRHGKDAQELVLLSAQRGQFLERIVRDHNFWGFDPESLHLLGIFSLLDALLALPMQEVVNHLPVDNKMKSALLRDPHNEYSPLLELTQLLEEARWQEAEAAANQLNLDYAKVIAAFQASIQSANQLESTLMGPREG